MSMKDSDNAAAHVTSMYGTNIWVYWVCMTIVWDVSACEMALKILLASLRPVCSCIRAMNEEATVRAEAPLCIIIIVMNLQQFNSYPCHEMQKKKKKKFEMEWLTHAG